MRDFMGYVIKKENSDENNGGKAIISAWFYRWTLGDEARNSEGPRWVHVMEHKWRDGLCDTALIYFSGHQISSEGLHLVYFTEHK
ncbi:hypothetical protein HAX54_049946, partial [Datura stramonium]|nr:hypothetical protein [Datura stramonium]